MSRLPDGAERPAHDYEPGQQIAGRYQVLEVLGHGASGVVYRVRDLTLGEVVAAKIIYDPEGGLERLKNEVRLARRVTHPNVCRVFDIVEHRHGALLTMEYVAGTTLAARIGVTHTDAEILHIARQICDALYAAHQAGVLHRDLKPHNVLLTREGRVVLTDFGIARPIASVLETDEAHQPGTPAYMAPEQLSGEPLDSRTDLYAVGLILYELCAGHLPFVAAGETPRLRHVLKRLDARIPPPKQHKRLAPLLFLLLAREAAARPSSAAVVKKTIERMQSGEKLPAPRRGLVFRSSLILGPVLLILLAMVGYRTVVSPSLREPQRIEVARPPILPLRRSLTGGDEGITEPPTFRDGGKSLVIATNRTGSFQLWSVATDDALSRQLTSGPRGKHFPQVAGNYLYYSLDRPDLGYDLVRVELASLSTLQSGDEAEVVRPRIDRAHVAANGSVVYLAPLVAGEGPGMHLVLPDGISRTLLDDERGEIRWPIFSPDAAHIAYLRQSSSGVALVVVELASGSARVLTRDVLFGNGLSWSADSQSVAYFRGDGSARVLVEVNRKTGAETVVLASAEHGTCPVHAEDGRLAYIDDQIDWDIWLYEQPGPLKQVTFLGDESAFSPTWSPALGELTYLVERPGDSSEVRRVGGVTLAETRARRAIPTDIPYIAVSASGRYVAYSDRQGAEARLLLAEIDSTAQPVVLGRANWPYGFLPAEFAPGDARLTYVAHAGEDRESSIWDVKLDGTDARLVLAGAGGGFRSRDGRWISFGRLKPNEPGRFLLHVQETDADGRPIGVPHAPLAYPLSSYRFAPNSRELIVLRQAGLFALDPRSGAERLLTRLPRGTLYPDRLSVSPDGRVAMSLGVGRQSLVVVDNYRALRP